MILVTGATGRLGGHIVRLLRRAGLPVRALVRPGSEYYWLNDSGCEYFFGDLRDARSLQRAARGCDYVVHAAGLGVESTENHHSLVTLQGAMDLFEAARMRGVKRVVMISALGVERGHANAWYDCLAQAEAHLLASGVEHCIIRCAPFAEEFVGFAATVAGGKQRLWGRADAQLSPLPRQEAALVAMAALDHPGLKNKVVELGGLEQLTSQQALELAMELSGAQGEPQWVGGVGARLSARLAGVGGRRWRNWIERQSLLYGEDSAVDSSALFQLLGLQRVSLEEAMRGELEDEHLGSHPEDRETRVTHRQFQSKVYEPGRSSFDALPEGPLREAD